MKKIVVLDIQSKEYDLQKETNSKICYRCPDDLECANTNCKDCHKVCYFNIMIDDKNELFYLVCVWVPYRCGYSCETEVYHRHGN